MSPFGGWFDRYYKEIYAPAVKEANLRPRRADDMYRPSAIVSDIWSLIRKSTVMLADLSERNPNVFYELGLAHALGKPVVLTTQNMHDVPFDLRALRVLEYDCADPSWADRLRREITAALREVLSKPSEAVLAPFLHADVKHQPHVSADEARFRAIEDQLARIAASTSSARRGAPLSQWDSPERPRPSMSRAQAERMIHERLESGEDPVSVYLTLVDADVPSGWALSRIGLSLGLAMTSLEELLKASEDHQT